MSKYLGCLHSRLWGEAGKGELGNNKDTTDVQRVYKNTKKGNKVLEECG